MRARALVWMVTLALAVLSAACGRTDAGITTAVKSKLAADDSVKAYQIDVDTSNKVVTLTGTVDTAMAKERAVEIARGTDGVTNVIDNVTLRPATAAAPPAPDAERAVFTDPALTTAVKAKFAADSDVSAMRIDVDTRDGVVTLTGRVKSQAEKDQALKLARETDGVKSVIDQLTINR